MAGIDLLNSLSGKGIDYGSVISVTAAATLDAAALGRIVVCSGTSADYTVVLPPVSESAGKRLLLIMDSALTKLVTIDGNAAETIDGAANRILWGGEVAELLCNGVEWKKVGGKSIPFNCKINNSQAQSFTPGQYDLIQLNQVVSGAAIMLDAVNYGIKTPRSGLYLLDASSSNNTAAAFSMFNQIWNATAAVRIAGNPMSGGTNSYFSVAATGVSVLAKNDLIVQRAWHFTNTWSNFALADYLTMVESPQW